MNHGWQNTPTGGTTTTTTPHERNASSEHCRYRTNVFGDSFDRDEGGVWISEPVREVQDLYGDLVGRSALVRTRFEQVQVLADRLADGHRRQHPGAYVELANWNPTLTGLRPEQLWERRLDRSDVVLAIARERLRRHRSGRLR